jgi:hypothetical protein
MRRDYGGRRPDRPANVLSTAIPRQRPPDWPLGTAGDDESRLWADLWRRPVAQLWRAQCIAPVVIARYVRVLCANPGSATLAQMEAALGLTPAALARLRVTFEPATAAEPLNADQRAVLALVEDTTA